MRERKILSIPGGGILGAGYLSCLLKISEYYDGKNIEFLDLFDVFCGVSVGSIIASGFVFKEKILNDKKNIDFIKRNQKIKSKSTKIIKFLIEIFEKRGSDIFEKNEIQLPKYKNKMKEIFKEYLDFDLKNIPANRTLVLKTVSIKDLSINIFTNHPNLLKLPNKFNGNKHSTNVAEIVSWSCCIPGLFQVENGQIDGGFCITNAIMECNKLFNEDRLIILSISRKFHNLMEPTSNILEIMTRIISIVPATVVNKFQKFEKLDDFHELEIDLKKLTMEDVEKIPEIINEGYSTNIEDTLNFLNK